MDSKTISLLSYTLRFVSLKGLDRLCQFGLVYPSCHGYLDRRVFFFEVVLFEEET